MSVLLLLTAVALGAAHAVAPDHLAAVGVFVSRSHSTREALTHGARWGLGHALTLTCAGLAVLFVASAWPLTLSLRAEWVVGVVLVALGVRTVWQATRGVFHPSAPNAMHVHTSAGSRAHQHPLVGIGMLHGLAGSGAMAAIVPLSAGQHPWQAALWLTLFGVGTIVAMALIAGAAGWSLRVASRQAAHLMRRVAILAGAASIVVGVLWLVRAPR